MTSEFPGVKAGVLVHPVRLACTGNPFGSSLYHVLEVMGRIGRALGNAGFGG